MYFTRFIKYSIREVDILSRIYKINKPAFIFNNKCINQYRLTDFHKDMALSIQFKKHPMILHHLPKYKTNEKCNICNTTITCDLCTRYGKQEGQKWMSQNSVYLSE